MRATGLARHYQHLKARERFLLVLEALARGDKQEARRLNDTCPRAPYIIDDPAYTELREASRLIVSVFTVFWLQAERDFRVAEAMVEAYLEMMQSFTRGWVLGANHGWRRAGREGALYAVKGRTPTEEELDEAGLGHAIESFPGELESLFRKRASTLKGTYEGLVRFCATVGLDPIKLLSWYPPVLEEIEARRGLLEGEIPPDEELAERIRQLLLLRWPQDEADGAAGSGAPVKGRSPTAH